MSLVVAEPSPLQCTRCLQYEDIARDTSLLLPGPGDTNFSFTCSGCHNGNPLISHHANKSFLDIGGTVLFNLALRFPQHTFFNLRAIREFVEAYGTQLGSEGSRNLGDLVKVFTSNPDRFECNDGSWALRARREISWGNEKRTKCSSRGGRGSEWCHQCKQKHDQIIHCSQDCSKKYCVKCIQRHYRGKETDIDPNNWVCAYCRQLCVCASCRKRKAKATDTPFESRRGKKRSMRGLIRGCKKRRVGQGDDVLSREDEDSEDYGEFNEEDEEEFVRESPVTSLTSTPAPIASPLRNNFRDKRGKHVTLKDLIESGFLVAGDELYFKKSHEFSGTLLPNGHISCLGKLCPTLSTFAKHAAFEVGGKLSRQNGWRSVYYHSRSLFELRREFLEVLVEGEATDYLMDDEEDDEDEEEADRTAMQRRLRSSANATVNGAKPLFYDNEDEEMSPAEASEHSMPIKISVEAIKLSQHYSWLQYEFQHEHDHVHMSPIFDDARHRFEMEHNSMIEEGSDDHLDIRDEYFFPMTMVSP